MLLLGFSRFAGKLVKTSIPNNNSCKHLAFTLAEVLITLGIIGVVAAMTLPALIAKYQLSVLSVQLRRTYSIISQAMQLATGGNIRDITVRGTSGGHFDSALYFYSDYLKPHLKINKECVVNNGAKDCMGIKYTKSGGRIGCTETDRLSFVLTDGTEVCVDTWAGTDYAVVSSRYGVDIPTAFPTSIGQMTVDINGEKQPNIVGKDVFIYVTTDKGLTPAGTAKTDEEINTECSKTGYYCFAKFQRNNWQITEDDMK